jgi:hypothetical protein
MLNVLRGDIASHERICRDYFSLPINKRNHIAQQDILRDKPSFQGYESLVLCHKTKYFPKAGYVHPRVDIDRDDSWPEYVKMGNVFLSIMRATRHFTVNHIVENHRDYSSVDEEALLIVSPLERNRDRIMGGYIEDIMIFGTWRIPDGSTIFIPQSSEERFKEELEQLPSNIRVVFYKGNLRQSFNNFCKAHKIPVMDFGAFPTKIREGVVLGGVLDGRKIFSDELAVEFGYKLLDHGATPNKIMEVMLTECFNSFDGQGLCTGIKEVLASINNIFQEKVRGEFFDSWKAALLRGVTILKLPLPLNRVLGLWTQEEKGITEFDKFSLKRPLDYNSTACLVLRDVTGLDFGLYYYNEKSDFLLNAICILPEQLLGHATKVATGLSTLFHLPFIETKLEGKTCIVVSNVNYPAVGTRIHKCRDVVVDLSIN